MEMECRDPGRNEESRLGWLPVHLLHLLDTMNDGVQVTDGECNVVYANGALRKDFGPPEGRKCHEYLHGKKERCEWCHNGEVFQGKMVRWNGYFPKVGKHFDLMET